MTATVTRAEFLKSEERFATASAPAMEVRWGEDAADTSQSSPLAFEPDAVAESARQLAQMGDTSAEDIAVITGLYPGLEGKTVRLAYGGRFGMAAEANMLVTRASLNRNEGTTTLQGFAKL